MSVAICLVGLLLTVAPPQKADLERSALQARIAGSQAMSQGHRRAALRHFARAVRLMERAHGERSEKLVPDLGLLATMTGLDGNYNGARKLQKRVLSIWASARGVESIEYGRALMTLATTDWTRGEFRAAERGLLEALRIYEKRLGPNDLQVAMALSMMASWYQARNDWPRAAALHTRALHIREQVSGLEDPSLLSPLFQLGWLHLARGDLDQAETIFQRILTITENPALPASTRAAYLMMTAQIYDKRGQPARAKRVWAQVEAVYQEAVKTAEAAGSKSIGLIGPLTQLGSFYMQIKQYPKAAPIFRRLLALNLARYGPKHPAVTGPLIQLGVCLRYMGQLDDARRLLQKADRVQTAWLGKLGSTTRLLLADLEHEAGRVAVAANLYRQVADAFKAVYGVRHPNVVWSLERAAILTWAAGHPRAGLRQFSEAMSTLETDLALQLQTGTERDKRNYLKRVAHHTDEALSLHFEALPRSQRAAEMALRLVLQRKGRLLDAVSDAFGALHRRLKGPDRALLDQLASARARLSKRVLQPPSAPDKGKWGRQVAALESAVRTLESQVSVRSPLFLAQTLPITVAGVRAAIPKDQALVELIAYHRQHPAKYGADAFDSALRYAAFVVGQSGSIRSLDLGFARPIDQLAQRFREALADPTRDDVRVLGRALDERLMRPIRTALGPVTRVLIAPDGPLNLVPFAALVDERDRFLIERYRFTYLTSGRDLLRLVVTGPARQAPTVVAAPAFDGRPMAGQPGDDPGHAEVASASRGRRSNALGDLHWGPLPGTAAEAQILSKIFESTIVITGEAATETALKAVRGPRLLHIATHGFFLPEPAGAANLDGAAENPLLRSGLVLSGANQRRSGEDDGVLTALEAAGLDLFGTRLVVLSACETGLGQIENGEGVYGLRRALVIAGSESQLISLWQVDDAATRDLMTSFYKRLGHGKGRADALRMAQRHLIANPETAHPFFWAGFIGSGQWRPL